MTDICNFCNQSYNKKRWTQKYCSTVCKQTAKNRRMRINCKKYYQKNCKKILDDKKQYYIDNKEQIISKRLKYLKKREQIDIIYKIQRRLRSRLYSALKGNYKTGSAVRDLGCTIDELKLHLESQFQDGMSWDNYGKWHIDHIEPLSKFNLVTREELLKACHYANLQPLWAKDNISKGNK